jgi:large subunit ribosomal protein L19
VRRAKLYYLREKVGKRARIRERRQPLGGEADAVRRAQVADAAAGSATDDLDAGVDEAETAPISEVEAAAEETEPGNV